MRNSANLKGALITSQNSMRGLHAISTIRLRGRCYLNHKVEGGELILSSYNQLATIKTWPYMGLESITEFFLLHIYSAKEKLSF